MGPKKGKDHTMDENYWRTSIENAPLDDDSWTVKVIMMEAAGSDQDRIYLNKFEVFAAEEKRFVIKNICKTETIFMVNQLGGEKKVKDDSLRVFEEGQAYLKEKKDIPPDIQALIVKHLILKMKEEYLFIKRQRLQVREGMSRESATMLGKAEVRGTVNVKPPEPPPPPPPPPTKKGKKGEPEPENLITEPDDDKKYNTLLRVRGEEWRDKVYVDDFPTDGPNLYVAVTGFVEPLLVECLLKIGVPLNAVIQIRIDPTKSKIPSTLLRATKRGQSQTDILTEKSLKYWEDLQQLRINKDSANELKNTAFVIFSPPYWDAESLSGNPDKIYDELCFLMYDIQDLTRQHFHYLENMDIINIPQEKEEMRHQKYYNEQIDDIPLECVTVYAILDSIIQTVCKIPNLSDENSRSTFSSALTFHQLAKNKEEKEKQAEGIVKDVFDALCMTDSTKTSYRLTYGEEYESHKDPIVIKHGDTARLSTYHLGNINMDNVLCSMLLGMPINKLWHNKDRPEGVIEAKVNFHVNVLLSCFERKDVETAELNRLIHILACRKLFNNRSSLKKHHLGSATVTEFKKAYLKRSVLAEPLPKCPSLFSVSSTTSPTFPTMTKRENASDLSSGDTEEERIRFLFDCPDISELVSAAEIANNQPLKHIIDDFEYFEDFTGTSAFQVLRDAFNKFNCVDYKYCEVTDCYVLMFYNSHDKEGIARDEWRCHLPTPLCLQDFFDFILEEHYNWIKNEEKLYDENLAIYSVTQSKVAVNSFVLESCIDNRDVSAELLMEGSLKFQEREALEDSDKEVDVVNAVPSKVRTVTSDVTSPNSRKTKSGADTSSRRHTPTYLASAFGSNSSVCNISKPFQGYDLGDRRVEVFGKDGIYYSKDGTRVSSLYTLLIPLNLEYVILNVVPGNGFNEFWVHRALGDFVSPEILSSCESFRITSKDQVMINVKKQIYQVPIPLTTESTADNQKLKEGVLKSTSELLNQLPIVYESKYFHSLYITWPNGLITETIYEDNSPTLSHIKQYYTQPVPKLDEEMRCISLNGEVIVFKESGDIEVLRPDGSFIKITKYGKRPKSTAQEDLPSEASSDKQKKAKGKDKQKVKEKVSKVSSKISKNAVQFDEYGPPEYELFIDEFETIRTNGLRQKWIGEISFDLNKLLIRTATDYCLGQIYSKRMDGTNILLSRDGVQVVTFPNRTRIITQFTVEEEEVYPEWTRDELDYFFDVYGDKIVGDPMNGKASMSQKSNMGVNFSTVSARSSTSRKFTEEEELEEPVRSDGYISVQISFTIEHANFASVILNKADGKVTVDSPNNTSVVLDINNHYEFHLDEVTRASFDGESLHIDYEACPECKSNTTCDIKICHDEMSSVTKVHQNWLKMKDSFCRKIVVNEEGCINLLDDTSDYSNENVTQTNSPPCPDFGVAAEEPEHVEVVEEDRMPEAKSESSITSHGKCREMYQAKTLRFFILKRELTCSELVHRALLDQYKTLCRWQPWCSIGEHDTFGDHRSLVSVLTPVHLTETEKWLMESKLADKPAYLSYKDLKKDSGKGFYHWMRPYGRFEPQPIKPANVLPPRLPRAFILRTLEKQWKEEERNDLSGARELLLAILQYRRLMEADSESLLHVAILDPRPEGERCTDEIVQALGHRVYEDLKTRLADDMQSHTRPDITTRPSFREPSVEGEMEDDLSEVRLLEEERESILREAEAEVMRPNLARYWRRRAEELKEEQFYLYLLREGSVPPYFRNLLGGAIWWEMNNTAGEAVTTAERRKMKCVCAYPTPSIEGAWSAHDLPAADDAKDAAGLNNNLPTPP